MTFNAKPPGYATCRKCGGVGHVWSGNTPYQCGVCDGDGYVRIRKPLKKVLEETPPESLFPSYVNDPEETP